jgi:hypothetical protein
LEHKKHIVSLVGPQDKTPHNMTEQTDDKRQKTANYLNGGEGGHNSRTAEAVSDERKVRQVALNVGFQDDLRPRVAQGRPILIEQVHQLFGDLPGKKMNV